jgi:hypothetical protein
MTNSSSKPLQTLGKWYQPRNPKKIPKPAQKKIPKTISHPFHHHHHHFHHHEQDDNTLSSCSPHTVWGLLPGQ